MNFLLLPGLPLTSIMEVLMFVIAYTSKMSRFFDLIANRRRLSVSFEYERTHAERSLAGASHKEDFGPKKNQHFYTWAVISHLAKTYFSDLATLDKKRNLFFPKMRSDSPTAWAYLMGFKHHRNEFILVIKNYAPWNPTPHRHPSEICPWLRPWPTAM